jgi:prepilin-type N-terminal cleavage/methylation domain-containing protein
MYNFSKKGVTLLEITVVLTVMGLLIAALSVSYSNYQKRWRDTVRAVALSNIGKSLSNYFTDFEKFPLASTGWCITDDVFSRYLNPDTLIDPLVQNNNGCNPSWYYGYGTSSWTWSSWSLLTTGEQEYVLLARLENPESGNYAGSFVGLTGTLTQSGYNNIRTLIKWIGQYYVLSR